MDRIQQRIELLQYFSELEKRNKNIRDDAKKGMSLRELSQKYNLSTTHIVNIKNKAA